MTRISLLILGAFAIMAGAICVLVLIPKAMLSGIEPPPQLQPYTPQQLAGREVYIANGCLYCHSQQVRDASFTTDVDRGWGSRPTVPADYVYDKPHLLGTMRTGPDLINVGQRLPDPDWQLIHLYDPRSLVEWSIMPGYPYLFEEKAPDAVRPDDRVVRIPGPRAPKGVVVVAKPEALALVDYLISLKRQYPVPDSAQARDRMATGGAHGSH
ncbi:MAG TPA: cbb3-type cytochrome c oxidase subunit II [Gemmatimonadaceae bacterium]|nr:cbb3-type cytochrome c oxidase subunit II [Gemmatimonadaceae bacterium]